jgi:hypothetical protein
MKLIRILAGAFVALAMSSAALAQSSNSLVTTNNYLGAPAPAACATDNGTCAINALLKRMNQRVTSLITAVGTPLQAGGNIGTVTAVTSITNPVAATQSGTWNITNISGTVTLPTGAATSAIQSSVIGTKAAGTAAASSELTGCVYNTSLPAPTNGQQVGTQCDSSGRQIVSVGTSALPTGAATAALQGAQGTGSTYNPPTGGSGEIGYLSGIYAAAIDTTPVPITLSATSGCTPGGVITTAATNALNVKASAGTFCGGIAINTTATLAYVRFYNLSTTPTCSSSTGWVASIPVPASTTGAGTPLSFGEAGAAFGTGIGWCITGGGANNDNTNAVAGVYLAYGFK